MTSTDRPIPLRCPACGNSHVRPCMVSVSHHQRVITYKCGHCGHTWTVAAKDEDLVMPPL